MEPRRLTLEQLTATAGGRSWTARPFALVTGFRSDWWQPAIAGGPKDWFTFYDSRQEELVRAEIEPHSDAGSHYQGVVVPVDRFALIQYFEVHSDNRCDGIGTEAIELLEEFYRGRQLAAFSEQADRFWASVGWTPHRPQLEPDDYAGHFQTFFLSPPSRTS